MVSVWANLAIEIDKLFSQAVEKPVIAIVTSTKMKIFKSKLFIKISIFAKCRCTHYIINATHTCFQCCFFNFCRFCSDKYPSIVKGIFQFGPWFGPCNASQVHFTQSVCMSAFYSKKFKRSLYCFVWCNNYSIPCHII